uniref:FGENESH: predicted gene_6.10 protein n=1 Tax=Rhodotorula toruloides TaxID=5286 RepID=A0A0K3CF78_RHOTO
MNNPFAKPPQTELSSAAQRFPDVLHTDPDLQQTQGQYGYAQGQGQVFAQQTGYGGGGMNGYAGQGQPQGGMGYGAQQQQGGYLQPQQTGYGGGGGYAGQSPMGGPGGIYSPGPGVQQQQYGYQQQQQPQYTGMQSYQPSYSSAPPPPVSDLDPYSSLSSSSFASPSPAPSSQQQAGSLQLDNRIDALREAWQTRLALLRAASEQGADPIKTEQLRKEGEGFVDSIHAAKMQLGEVKAGWRHSTDAASKSRVREALNAGLSSLPLIAAELVCLSVFSRRLRANTLTSIW